MDIDELEIIIEKNKTQSPETFNEILNVTIPFYTFYKQMNQGICQLEEEKYRINHSEVDVLSSLKILGDKDYILSPKQLHQKLLFTGGAITKVLKKLEEKKYIRRLDNKYDKRSKLVQLTKLGIEVNDKVLKDIIDFEEKCFSALNEEEKQTMKNLLLKMTK